MLTNSMRFMYVFIHAFPPPLLYRCNFHCHVIYAKLAGLLAVLSMSNASSSARFMLSIIMYLCYSVVVVVFIYMHSFVIR
jgi:hypothetical protein